MTQRYAFLVQVLEKMGAPFMDAVRAVSLQETPDETAEESDQKEAEQVAELINKAVQVSIGLADTMELQDNAEQADSIRLALAGMAAPLVANQYRLTGKIPGDNDIKKIVSALEAVLTFADHFGAAAENMMRLEALDIGVFTGDESQVNIQYMQALQPVLTAVAAFPFGQPENKLVQDVANNLIKRAEALAKDAGDFTTEQERRRAELSLLKTLSEIYATCHRAETDRLMAMNEEERTKAAEEGDGTMTLDTVWSAFETRLAMLHVLGKAVQGKSAEGAAPAATTPETEEKAESSASSETPSSAEKENAAAPSEPKKKEEEKKEDAESSSGESSDSGGGDDNPMAFFKPGAKKPPADDENTDD